jgi:hypothetical protein
VEGAHATVSWIGCLPDKGEQVWVGVDFDDAKRGKHDGSRDGVQYFSARTKTSGSFVKIEKLDRGVSLAAALAQKFDGQDADDEMVFLDYKTGRTKEVLFVGKEQVIEHQSKQELLEQVKLVDAGVSWCGDLEYPALNKLAVEQSLIGNWGVVRDLLGRLPALRHLSLAGGRLGAVGDYLEGATFPLEVLVLNACGITWDDIIPLCKTFPNLQELHIRYSSDSAALGAPPAGLTWPGIKHLVLDENGINSWDVLTQVLVAFPDLEALQMNENELGDEGVPELLELPERLVSISLAGNRISKWETIGKLCGRDPVMTKITHMRLSDNPIAQEQIHRQVVIALMPGLEQLNIATVRKHERDSAERGLLSYQVQGKPIVAQVDPDGEHCKRLTAIHGEGIAGAEEAKSLKDSLVQLDLVPAAVEIMGKASIQKKVPGFLEVEQLKVLCSKLFKIPLETIRLGFFEDGAPVARTLEAGDLQSNGLANGSSVHVGDTRDDFKEKERSD